MRCSPIFWPACGIILVACLCLTGCGQSSPAAAQTEPPPVTVAEPLQQTVTDYEDFTGRSAAIESVQIMARVTGYLDKIYFREGVEVREGTVLYEIDPRPYQAAYDQVKAQVAQNEASLQLAISNRKHYEEAYKQHAVTPINVETFRSQEAQAMAALAASKASLETARLNLQWTKVTAPITGRLSQALVSRGNLVTADQTALTTMVSLDPMYVYFDVDEATVERIQQLIREGKLKSALPEEIEALPAAGPKAAGSNASAPGEGPLAAAVKALHERADQMRKVFLGLANGHDFPHVAYVDFFNNQISLATATLQVRAVFWNPKPRVGPRIFDPGMFVRVRVPTSPEYKALLVAQEAIGSDQDLKYVDVLNDQQEVVRRVVKLGGLQDGLQVVAEGLKPGERVLINGLQHVRSGIKVNPKLVPMPLPPSDTSPQTSPPVTKVPPAAPKSQ